MATEYTYAVSRIRSKELSLLSKHDLDSLMNCADYDECIKYLQDKGFGEDDKSVSADELLSAENQKTWQLIKELVGDTEPFKVFLLPNDFHNLKVSLKAITRDAVPTSMFIDNGTVSADFIYESVKKREYSVLPAHLSDVAKKAMSVLLQTGDGQLCDIIIDKASLEAIHSAGNVAENEIIKLYAELTVAFADIKIAVRCLKTEKSLDFIKNCLASCDTLNIDLLAKAATKSMDDIYNCLYSTDYRAGVEQLKKSTSAFEKWCDDLLIEQIKPQKWEPFTIGPLAAYIVARDTEIKAVRIILSGKLNELDDSIIKERLRDMYV